MIRGNFQWIFNWFTTFHLSEAIFYYWNFWRNSLVSCKLFRYSQAFWPFLRTLENRGTWLKPFRICTLLPRGGRRLMWGTVSGVDYTWLMIWVFFTQIWWIQYLHLQRLAKSHGCLLSYSQAEPGRKITQPSPRLLAEPCMLLSDDLCERADQIDQKK